MKKTRNDVSRPIVPIVQIAGLIKNKRGNKRFFELFLLEFK